MEDDEYDGDFTEDDEERPRILIQFKVTDDAGVPKSTLPSGVSSNTPQTTTVKTHTTKSPDGKTTTTTVTTTKTTYTSKVNVKEAVKPSPTKHSYVSKTERVTPQQATTKKTITTTKQTLVKASATLHTDAERYNVENLRREMRENLSSFLATLSQE